MQRALASSFTSRCLTTSTRPLFTKADAGIAGTVGPHSSYLFLRAPTPPPDFPSKMTSPLYNLLLLKLPPLGCAVNWVWYGDEAGKRLGGKDGAGVLFTTDDTGKPAEVVLDKLDEGNVEDIVELVSRPAPTSTSKSDDVHLLVCTHAARDCRCGDIGGPFADALREEIKKRVSAGEKRNVWVGETGHVGGHKHAANLLVYPYGEW